MAKMRDIMRGVRAVKAVEFRRANAGPAEPGQDPASDSATVRLGVRVLLGGETEDVYQRAEADARKRGVTSWIADHPICNSAMMVQTILLACVDIDSPPEARAPFFDSAEQIRGDDEIGSDNIALLYQHYVDWLDEVSGRGARMSAADAVKMVLADAQLKEGELSPLVHLPRASLVSLVRSMASLWLTSLNPSWRSGSDSAAASTSSPSGMPSDPRPEAASGGGRTTWTFADEGVEPPAGEGGMGASS